MLIAPLFPSYGTALVLLDCGGAIMLQHGIDQSDQVYCLQKPDDANCLRIRTDGRQKRLENYVALF
jgi:hypothetical protein